ncbi:BREX-1 system phosphatase PglZ type A, partial [Carnobacterium sp.]|uniref:BREX-1 system phosphatase PglZ type A n=1 Tax=Carnobacterium sp. TaxID=48221 RepID=UPI0028B1680E
MATEIETEIQHFFSSPLQTGEKRKILYLYDEEKQYAERVKELHNNSPLFELLEVNDHNYFYTHYQIEKEQSEKNILLYFAIKRPADQENPLLGVLLYSQELKLDHESQFYATIGIDATNDKLTFVAKQYQIFFKSKERTTKFNRLFQQLVTQNADTMEFCILAVLTKADQSDWIASFIELFNEIIQGQTVRWKNIQKFGNVNRFWAITDRLFGFNLETSKNTKLSIKSLSEQLFVTHLASEWPEELPKSLKQYVLPKTNQTIIFINQWTNFKDQQESYTRVANRLEKEIGIDELFNEVSLTNIAEVETFQWFDRYLVQQIAGQLADGGIDYEYYDQLIVRRRGTFWYTDYRAAYHALRWSLKLFKSISEMNSILGELKNEQDVWLKYQTDFYRIDQAYRKFHFYYDQLTGLLSPFESLKETVEQSYQHTFLEPFTKKWDKLVMKEPQSNLIDESKQQDFYVNEIQPFVEQDKKVIVIISDGLRYESGKELFQRLMEENRFSGSLSAMQTELPSNTALGMAALLPHKYLMIQPSGKVDVDGLTSESIEKRNEILQRMGSKKSLAIGYDTINQMNRNELRSTFAGKKLIYIYHNRIDAIGDQRITENDVFSAVEETLQQVKRLLTRLATEVSAAQLFVTADHGFLYSRKPVQPVEKVTLDNNLEGMVYNKRFILSKEEMPLSIGLSFPLGELANSAGYVLVPRGTNRFALAGGGYQYIHGGHLPQETMVPLLNIKTTRGRNETPQVAVKLLSQTRRITNNIVWLEFLQLDPVSEVLKEKQITVYFEDDKGNKLSNEQL